MLPPEEFGIVAATLVVLNLLELVGPLGLGTAVVQRKEIKEERYFHVAWTYDTVLMKLLAAVLWYHAAPFVADFFATEGMATIVRVLALVPIVQVVENEAMMRVTRKLDFRRRFFIEVPKGVVFGVVIVPLALIIQNAWAFVFATLAGTAARSASSYFVYPHLPQLRFDWDVVVELFPFSKWVFGLHLIDLTQAQLDRLIVGGMLGSVALGVFEVGTKLSLKAFSDLTVTTKRCSGRSIRGFRMIVCDWNLRTGTSLA